MICDFSFNTQVIYKLKQFSSQEKCINTLVE